MEKKSKKDALLPCPVNGLSDITEVTGCLKTIIDTQILRVFVDWEKDTQVIRDCATMELVEQEALVGMAIHKIEGCPETPGLLIFHLIDTTREIGSDFD